MKLVEVLEQQVSIDNERGLGSVPYNQEIDHLGIRVQMKPSVFLRLALPLSRKDATSTGRIQQHLEHGGAIGSPYLQIILPAGYTQGLLAPPAHVDAHEGRNRMYAIKDLYGDNPVEVHLLFPGGYRARDIKPELVDRLREGMISEGQGGKYVKGPLF